jgi:hypothetical protein
MTNFEFFRFFRIFWPQMVFIGGWGTKCKFFRFFFKFFGPQTVKNGQICIQPVKFVFKWSNLNLNWPISSHHIDTTHRLQGWAVSRVLPTRRYYLGRLQRKQYRSPPGGLKPYRPLTPPRRLLRAMPPRGVTASGAGGSTCHWNQPYSLLSWYILLLDLNCCCIWLFELQLTIHFV